MSAGTRDRRLLVLLAVALVVVASGCLCDNADLTVDTDSGRLHIDDPSDVDDRHLVGLTRWVVVRHLGPTPWSEGGYVAVPTHSWGEAPDEPRTATVLTGPRSLVMEAVAVSLCVPPDAVPPLGTVRYLAIDAQGNESSFLTLVSGEDDTGPRTRLDQEYGQGRALPPITPDLTRWNSEVVLPRDLLVGLLALLVAVMTWVATRVSRSEWERRPESWHIPFRSLGSLVVWLVTGLGLSAYLAIETANFYRSPLLVDTQPGQLPRTLAIVLAIVGVAVAAARPWLPASATAWTVVALVAASACAAAAGPWLVVLVPVVTGFIGRWDEITAHRRLVAFTLAAGVAGIVVTVLWGGGAVLAAIVLFFALGFGGMQATVRARRRREIPFTDHVPLISSAG